MPKMKAWDGASWIELNANSKIYKGGTLVGNRGGINFIEGSNITLSVADNGVNDRLDVIIAASGGSAGYSGTGTIPITGWTTASGSDFTYQVSVALTGVTAVSIVNVYVDRDYLDIAQAAQLCATVESYDGGVIFYTNFAPTIAIPFTWSTGTTGSTGYTGSIGYTGSQGAGYTGSQGGIGYTGSLGYTGSQGIGYTGSQGGIGYTGSQGDTSGILRIPSVLVSTSKTLALTDGETHQKCLSASAIVITIPLASSVNFPIDTEISFSRYGAGTITFTPISGVTINSADAKLTIERQYKTAVLKKIAANEWLLFGALV